MSGDGVRQGEPTDTALEHRTASVLEGGRWPALPRMTLSLQPQEIEGFHSENMPLGLCAQIQACRDQCHGTPGAGGGVR